MKNDMSVASPKSSGYFLGNLWWIFKIWSTVQKLTSKFNMRNHRVSVIKIKNQYFPKSPDVSYHCSLNIFGIPTKDFWIFYLKIFHFVTNKVAFQLEFN